MDDSYTVECSITVLKKTPARNTAAAAAATAMDRDAAMLPSLELHRNLGELLQKGTGADITFHVSGEKFVAHKAILASRSLVFMAELFGGMKEESSRHIEVKDCQRTVVSGSALVPHWLAKGTMGPLKGRVPLLSSA